MLQTFKQHNEAWSKVRCVMADKDKTERDVMRQELPDACSTSCARFDVRCRRISSPSPSSRELRPSSRELRPSTYYRGWHTPHPPEAYERIYAEFCASVPQAVRTYFDRNWHGIRQEWVACHKRGHGNYMTDTNNRLESINQKLKAVVKRYSSPGPQHSSETSGRGSRPRARLLQAAVDAIRIQEPRCATCQDRTRADCACGCR